MDCDELYISYFFPPSNQASGITVFKRIIENNRKFDVLHGNFTDSSDFNDYVNPYINKGFTVSLDDHYDWADFIYEFIEKGLKVINNKYKRINSRSWLMANHFLACEYKFKHHDVFWSAEFSDPLIYDINNQPKTYEEMIIDDDIYISKINHEIEKLDGSFPLIDNEVSAYFLAEYLVYLFADEIIFTNKNQREIMLTQFPVDVKNHVLNKSVIRKHPTLKDGFYYLKDIDLNLDNNCLNLAYFGNDYYSKRNFESLFYAVESLNHKFKDKIKIYLYLSDDKLIEKLVPSNNFIVKKPLDYLDFLNATTKFDVLIVNDMITKDYFKINPYLPSKLSDYFGSGSDIWALYESGSSLSKYDLKYKSDINDYEDCFNVFIRILENYGFKDNNSTVDNNYMTDRLTFLNELCEKEFNTNQRLKRQTKKLKNENKEIKSSNSWKITKPLRKIRKQ